MQKMASERFLRERYYSGRSNFKRVDFYMGKMLYLFTSAKSVKIRTDIFEEIIIYIYRACGENRMNITYRQMQEEDIAKVIPLFIEYWNGTGDEWTPELVYRRVWQVLGSPDSYCMIAEKGVKTAGFAMGRFETFYDLTAYNLVEIIVASEYQQSGVGTEMMSELERRVGQLGAAMVQLVSVNDEMHNHFYGKLGYKDATNLKLKSKLL